MSGFVRSLLFARPAPAVGVGTRGAGLSQAEAIFAARRRHSRWRFVAFLLLVALPSSFAIVFYALIAAPRYVSETRIVVRSASTVRMTGLDLLFRTIGFSKAVDDAYVVRDYLLSRDILRDLDAAGLSVRAIFTRPQADRLSRHPRFWRHDSQEALHEYFLDRVSVTEDDAKGILTLRVIAFTADDAHGLARAMVRLAEAMINRMNERSQRDATASAEEEVRLARREIADAQMALTSFRNNEALIDPSRASLSVIETIAQLSTDLSYVRAELAQVQKNSPGSPVIPSLRSRIAALEGRIQIEQRKVAGAEGSLSNKIAAYDQLSLRRAIAEQRLTAAIGSLEAAGQEARRQHIYIEQVVAPAWPDAPMEPRRIRAIITVLVVGLVLFGVYWIFSVAAEEHAQ